VSARESNPLGIPRNVLAAARRAGLSYPTWYVGRRQGPPQPRKKTLADLVREVEERRCERCTCDNPATCPRI
jgi:hypothetical protein